MVQLRQLSSILIAVAVLTGPAVAQNVAGNEAPGVTPPAALLKTIDIQFTNATVVEAAAALSKVSGVPIHVDPSVPNDTRLSIDAHGINAGSILMTIANDADLRIDPIEPYDGGIILRPYPYLVVNGVRSVQKGLGAPWGPGWSHPIGITRNPVGPASLSVSASRIEQSSPNGSAGDFRGVPGSAVIPALPGESGAGVAVAALSDHELVVAMPGQNDQGERGVWLALFVINGNEIRWLSSTFHALGEASGHAVGSAGAR